MFWQNIFFEPQIFEICSGNLAQFRVPFISSMVMEITHTNRRLSVFLQLCIPERQRPTTRISGNQFLKSSRSGGFGLFIFTFVALVSNRGRMFGLKTTPLTPKDIFLFDSSPGLNPGPPTFKAISLAYSLKLRQGLVKFPGLALNSSCSPARCILDVQPSPSLTSGIAELVAELCLQVQPEAFGFQREMEELVIV